VRGPRLRRERWTCLTVVAAHDRLTLAVDASAFTLNGACPAAGGDWHLAADADGRRCFDGKLEEPFAYADAIAETAAAAICRTEYVAGGADAPSDAEDAAAEAEFRRLIDDPPAGSPLVHFAQMWHALHGDAGPPDRTFDLREARLVNAPTLAVTGRHWDDDTTDFRAAADEYAAVHFHSDDLDDAGWEPCCMLEVPSGLASGVYAFELRAGELTDHVPFAVRPPSGSVQADVVLLLPTLTYQVYGNERLIAADGDGMAPAPLHEVHPDPADRWLAAHPEAGASCYDVHPGGHGISLVSMRRPIPNLRPSYVWWLNDSPERFAADLYLVDWLEEQGIPFDVVTDHDLHAEGLSLIEDYDVLLTGTHPEYCSRTMLDALERYVRDEEGNLMYLGGNGFYWVTSIDPERPYLAEVRRGVNGTRAWSSRPGELRHQTTGEQGGLWRYRGRDPNRLVGVGFAAQCDTPDRAPGYRRTPASHEPEHAWMFAGVEAELVGDHGLFVGGAAGYEIDRHDPAHGSPADAVVLATSAGLHPPSYLLVVEDLEVTAPEVTGPTTDLVRADLTYMPPAGEVGGAVFSVGSISWCGSLSHNGYDNDISRITANVLRRFTAGPEPS
jgi:N,N-dimethylformamidase beta subunit-like, C-terminal